MKNYISSEYLSEIEIGRVKPTNLPEPNMNDFKDYIAKIEPVYKKYKRIHT